MVLLIAASMAGWTSDVEDDYMQRQPDVALRPAPPIVFGPFVSHQVNVNRAGFDDPQSVEAEVDRASAIARAIAGADTGDVILVAGKGHEDYQEIEGVRHPFSDVETTRALLGVGGGV